MNKTPQTLKSIQTEHMIADVYKALVTDAVVNATIPEKVFVEHFLPLFCGEETTHPIGTYSQWADIAQGYYNEVLVIALNGETVVTVPPLFDRLANRPRTQRDAVSLGEALQTMELMAESSPIRAVNYFNKVANVRSTDTTDMRIKHMQDWNAVFKHYGKQQIQGVSVAVEAQSTESRVLSHSDDDLL